MFGVQYADFVGEIARPHCLLCHNYTCLYHEYWLKLFTYRPTSWRNASWSRQCVHNGTICRRPEGICSLGLPLTSAAYRNLNYLLRSWSTYSTRITFGPRYRLSLSSFIFSETFVRPSIPTLDLSIWIIVDWRTADLHFGAAKCLMQLNVVTATLGVRSCREA